MKSQVITNSIRDAIWSYYKSSGNTQLEIARLIGISDPSFNAWLNGKAKKIRPQHWAKILPLIEPFLDKKSLQQITIGMGGGITIGGNSHVGNIKKNDFLLGVFIDKILANGKLDSEAKLEMIRLLRETE